MPAHHDPHMAGSHQSPNSHGGEARDWTGASRDWQRDAQSAKRRRLDDPNDAYSWHPAVHQDSQASSLRLASLQLLAPRPPSFARYSPSKVAPSFSYEQARLTPSEAHQRLTRLTSHNTPFLSSTSTPLEILSATVTCGKPEQEAEPQHSTQIRFSSEEQDQVQADPVCFGRIQAIRGKCDRGMSAEATAPFPVQVVSSDRFVSKDAAKRSGKIATEHGQVIQGLVEETSLQLFATCTLMDEPTERSTKAARAPLQRLRPCTLDITIYGPLDIFEEIGTWFQDHELYLQDPLQCHLDAKYCNPHKLCAEDMDLCPTVSDIVRQSSGSLLLQDVLERPDLLDILSNGGELEETEQPAVIRAVLKRHQKQALTFMLRRERGWGFRENQSDIWEYLDADYGEYFLNRISGAHQVEEPPPFRGGIIADPMGLGKTLTIISLVATDLEQNSTEDTEMDMDEEEKRRISATLVIIPPPLIGTWEHELSEHVIPDGLEFRRHHGKTRLSNISDLDGVNLVLTTYHTVSAEWKPSGRQSTSVLFSVRWRRIILDEAHFIRNLNSKMARAACELASVSRWAVTGTPIQNRLSDLAAQLRFIRAHPYDDVKQFEADVSRLWKAGDDEEAVKRLKRLSACLLLRRAKATINLPARRDMTCAVDFSREERAAYDTMKQQTISKIDEALHTDSDTSRAGVYVNVLQQIESLRLFCNLGHHYHKRHSHGTQSASAAEEWAVSAQRAFNVQREMGPIICLQCSSTTELTETLLDDTPDARQQAQLFRCLRFACGDCMKKLQGTKHALRCGHKPSCPIAPVCTSHTVMEEVPAEGPDPESTAPPALPSKIRALVADIKAIPTDVKSVVFSTWRLTLDIVEKGLRDAGIRSIRFDGSVPQKDRQSVVDSFKTDPGIRVMLLTLSCGAVGLTLTEASRAYLMEPHWNPTLEEQALARIHRIGQTKEVTTVRLYIRDSFEEQVMELQNAKRQLAGVLLSPHDGGHGDDSLGGLHKLRSLL